MENKLFMNNTTHCLRHSKFMQSDKCLTSPAHEGYGGHLDLESYQGLSVADYSLGPSQSR